MSVDEVVKWWRAATVAERDEFMGKLGDRIVDHVSDHLWYVYTNGEQEASAREGKRQ